VVKIKNLDIRAEAKVMGVRLWEIADQMGLMDCNFSRKLRKELSNTEKEQIRQIIAQLGRRNDE